MADTDADNSSVANDLEGAFTTSTNFSLLGTNDGNPGLITFEYNAVDGSSVSGIIAANESGSAGDCEASGHVLST